MLHCDFCRFANIDLRRLQSDKNRNGYLMACKSCELEKELGDIPTYESSQLLEFYEQRKRDPISPVIIDIDDGSKYIQFVNGGLQFLNREELKLIADEIYKTLAFDESLDIFIEDENLIRKLKVFCSYSEKNRDKFQIPYDCLKLSQRYFNPDKRKWIFKCGNCSELINIDVQEHYYTIVPEDMFNAVSKRGCSKECTKLIVKDIVKNWLHASDIDTYFYIDDLNKEIIDLICKA